MYTRDERCVEHAFEDGFAEGDPRGGGMGPADPLLIIIRLGGDVILFTNEREAGYNTDTRSLL